MPVVWLEPEVNSRFPPLEDAVEDGLLAAGGDLSTARLLNAYQQGIFPWFGKDDPILWWSPNPRMVLYTDKIKVSKSLKKTLRTSSISVTIDHAFEQVITACSLPRNDQNTDSENSTWIHPDMIDAYIKLHQQGHAHSVECWYEGQLVGGLYGVAIGNMFFGESMFSQMKDSSKIALVTLCQQLHKWGFPLIDCQVYSSHLESLGAEEIARNDFMQQITPLCQQAGLVSAWALD